MKAIVYRSFGSPEVLSLEEVDEPRPGPTEVLVRVEAASVNPLDWHMVRGTPRLMRLSSDLRAHRPMRPGRDLAGIVEAAGKEVSRFAIGDAVFGVCQGAFAEYVCCSEASFAPKPAALSFEDAAAMPIAGLTALQGIKDAGGVRPGQRVLVNGASGGVGTFAIQIAKVAGAEVTAVCSAGSADLVRRIGADHVIDYRRSDFTQGSERYDLILDAVGNRPFRRLRRMLSRGGKVVAIGGGGPGGRRLGRFLLRALSWAAVSRFSDRRVLMCMSRWDLADMEALTELVLSGKVVPIVDRRYGLSDVVQALRFVAQGRAHGKVLITGSE